MLFEGHPTDKDFDRAVKAAMKTASPAEKASVVEGPGAKAAQSPEQAALNDAVLGLINLGYKQVEAQKAVKKLLEEGSSPEPSALLRGALRLLSQS